MNILMNVNVNVYVSTPHGIPCDAEEVGQALAGKLCTEGTVADLQTWVTNHFNGQRRLKTVCNYRTALRSLARFATPELPLARLDTDMIQRYEQWLRQQGVCLNTISCYLRSLRSLFKLRGLGGDDVFKDVYTGKAKTRKRSVPEDVFLHLSELRLRHGTFIALARDAFLFSFFAQGMPFVDLAHLRISQIADGHIVYQRRKTGQRIIVKIEPCMQTILNRYRRTASPYAFPFITHTEERQAEADYQQALNRYNRALKRLAALTGTDYRLTSYVARHSWASQAYSQNVDIGVIAQALGHGNPQTTLTYVRELDDHRIEEANHRLLEHFAGALPDEGNKGQEK